MTKLLSVKNLKKIYYSENSEIEAIKDLTFDISPSEFISIVGPSGCGKSTLLNILTDMDSSTCGKIIHHIPNLKFGYMLQSDSMLPWKNIYDNVTLGLELQKKKTKENLDYVDHLLNLYGLEDFKTKYPEELSGGMRERVG